MKKGFIAVFLAILCTFLFYGIRYTKSPVASQKAVYGTYEDSVDTTCFFARDEVVYSAETSGTVYNSYSDGMRVRSGALVSTVYSGEVSDENLQMLKAIDKKIESAKALSAAGTESVIPDESNLENRIDTYKYNIISAALDNDIESIKKYKNAINSLRSGVSMTNQEAGVAELEAEKVRAESQIGGTKQEIITQNTGVFLSVLDGMEHILTPENVKELTVRDFEKITVNKTKTTNKTVIEGDSVCKVVNNHQWYIVCSVGAERVEDTKLNSNVTMRFDEIPGVDVTGKIIHMSEVQDGKCIVVIESSQYVESAYSMRSSSMELIFKSYSGYKLPIYAIRNQDGQQGVIAKRNNVENFYPCEILYTNKEAEYVIINSPDDATRKLDDVDEFVLGER